MYRHYRGWNKQTGWWATDRIAKQHLSVTYLGHLKPCQRTSGTTPSIHHWQFRCHATTGSTPPTYHWQSIGLTTTGTTPSSYHWKSRCLTTMTTPPTYHWQSRCLTTMIPPPTYHWRSRCLTTMTTPPPYHWRSRCLTTMTPPPTYHWRSRCLTTMTTPPPYHWRSRCFAATTTPPTYHWQSRCLTTMTTPPPYHWRSRCLTTMTTPPTSHWQSRCLTTVTTPPTYYWQSRCLTTVTTPPTYHWQSRCLTTMTTPLTYHWQSRCLATTARKGYSCWIPLCQIPCHARHSPVAPEAWRNQASCNHQVSSCHTWVTPLHPGVLKGYSHHADGSSAGNGRKWTTLMCWILCSHLHRFAMYTVLSFWRCSRWLCPAHKLGYSPADPKIQKQKQVLEGESSESDQGDEALSQVHTRHQAMIYHVLLYTGLYWAAKTCISLGCGNHS